MAQSLYLFIPIFKITYYKLIYFKSNDDFSFDSYTSPNLFGSTFSFYYVNIRFVKWEFGVSQKKFYS